MSYLNADLTASIARQSQDEAIQTWGKNCTLVYPPRRLPCANCVFDSITNSSSGRYQAGGPISFENGTVCPHCGGAGWREESAPTSTVKLLIAWMPNQFWDKVPFNVKVPEGMIQTKGFMTDAPALLQSRRMVIENSLTPLIRLTFDLAGELQDIHNMNQGRYCVFNWSRAKGG